MKHFISTLNPITLQMFLHNYLYQSKLDYLRFPPSLKFFTKHLNLIKMSWYDYRLQYKLRNNKNENKSKSYKNRKRNIIWYNTSFSRNVSNNIGKYFLLFIQKYFPDNHKHHKIFNKNNVRTRYSCIANIKSIPNMHNKEVITEKKTQAVKCSCMNKPDCPVSNQCEITNIIYKGKITSIL